VLICVASIPGWTFVFTIACCLVCFCVLRIGVIIPLSCDSDTLGGGCKVSDGCSGDEWNGHLVQNSETCRSVCQRSKCSYLPLFDVLAKCQLTYHLISAVYLPPFRRSVSLSRLPTKHSISSVHNHMSVSNLKGIHKDRICIYQTNHRSI
jgi:hypothetical protein